MESAMRLVVKKWGNSAALRLPAAFMQSMNLHLDQVVEFRQEGDRFYVEPIRDKEYDLDEMLATVKPEHLHPSANTGPAVGKERVEWQATSRKEAM
jgi:antitoxin MazE